MKPKHKRGLEVYQTSATETQGWRWRIRGRNGLIIAASSEAYSQRAKARSNLRAIFRVLQASWDY